MAISDFAIKLSNHGPLAAAELRKMLGISPATLSRLIAAEGDQVLRFGRARATRYAMRRGIDGLPQRMPLYRIDAEGNPREVGMLSPVMPGSWVETNRGPGHLYAGLPPALVDMSPSGYLGRRFAELHRELRLPESLLHWSDDHRLLALARRGEDVPGDLVLGAESLDRYFASPQPRAARRSDYPRLAEMSALGGAGSSAAGEQPKFTTWRDGHHLLVKFTAGDGSPTELRWRDLLICEELALAVLSESGVAASRAHAVEVGTRRFLEVERFDRIGMRGRRGVLTLAPIDDYLFGGRDSWTAAAQRFLEAKLLSPEDARTVRLLEAFGICIANGDRHFGNLAFFCDELSPSPRLALAPAYDMLPMELAPRAGFLPALQRTAPIPQARLLEVWSEAQRLGELFWRRVKDEPRISRPFRRAAVRAT